MKQLEKLPFICVRDIVIFPKMTAALYIGRKCTINAITHSQQAFQSHLVIFCQKKAAIKNPARSTQIYRTGTICKIISAVRLTDGTMKIKVVGLATAQAHGISFRKDAPICKIRRTSFSLKPREISAESAIQIRDLFVSANPSIAFDADATWLPTLGSTQNLAEIIETLLANLHYAECRNILANKQRMLKKTWIRDADQFTKMQHAILDAKDTHTRVKRMGEYLRFTVKKRAIVL